jgi:CheY-like chemotaxis protein
MIDPKATLLLVEDNEDDIFMMRRAMRIGQVANPLQVVTDGQCALDYLSGSGEYGDRDRYPLPAVVFLDLKLPYVDGFEILSWLGGQPSLSSIIVVVLTSSAEVRDRQKAEALGAKSYLVKPPSAESVNDVLKSLG